MTGASASLNGETGSAAVAGGRRSLPRRARVAIIGGGFSGLGMAIRLKQRGEEDFVLIERGADVGGTWRENTYPGAVCDVPSHLYSFSFALNPDWSRSFSPQPEIQSYLRRCAREHGIYEHSWFGTALLRADWIEERGRWRIGTTGGTVEAQFLVSGMGALSEPFVPRMPGMAGFEGRVFHSAAWDHGYDLRGKRVAVVGTGASAVQFVPEIQPEVESLHLFQRTPAWVLPRREREYRAVERRLFRKLPGLARMFRRGLYLFRESYVFAFYVDTRLIKGLERLARSHLRKSIEDPELRERLTPDYTIGCKRILMCNTFYPALRQPNAEVMSSGLSGVRGSTVVGSDGTEREVDAIIFATGFRVTDSPAAHRVFGREGRSLGQTWSRGMQAYKGTTVAGFPNMFWLLGPNTGLGHNSIVYMIESQIEYALDSIRSLELRGAEILEVRPEAQSRYDAEVQRRLERTVWNTGGCKSWYLDRSGRNSTLWPTFTWLFKRQTTGADPQAYFMRDRALREDRTPPGA